MDAPANPLEFAAHRPKLRVHTAEEADAFARSCRDAGYQYIRFEIADMAGLSRGKTVPLAHVAGYLRVEAWNGAENPGFIISDAAVA